MTHAELCPVCKGSGKIHHPPADDNTSRTGYDTTCHGCGGKGWVEVNDQYVPYTPLPYYPYPWQPYPEAPPIWITCQWSGHWDSASAQWVKD